MTSAVHPTSSSLSCDSPCWPINSPWAKQCCPPAVEHQLLKRRAWHYWLSRPWRSCSRLNQPPLAASRSWRTFHAYFATVEFRKWKIKLNVKKNWIFSHKGLLLLPLLTPGNISGWSKTGSIAQKIKKRAVVSCNVRLSHHPQPTTDTEKNQGRVRFPNPKDRAKTMSLPEASSFSEWMGGVSRQQNNEEIIKNHKKTTNGLVFAHSQREKERKRLKEPMRQSIENNTRESL